MDFSTLRQRPLDIRQKFQAFEEAEYGAAWTREQVAQGLVGDVGDLMKLVMAKEGRRQIDDTDAKLAHELADCLWSIIVLAEEYGVDLEEAFEGTMGEIEARVG